MKKVIFALTNSEEHAQRIVDKLQRAGFDTDEISFLMSDKEERYELKQKIGGVKIYEKDKDPTKGTLGHEKHTKAPEGGITGGVAGGVIGGSIGLLAGIGSLALPGLGMFIVAGPLVAALSGSAVGGALGLLVGALIGLGLPEYEAKKYESMIKKGHVLLCVHTYDTNQLDLAEEILQKEGATDIGISTETPSSRP